jgi:hypothetical protein
MILKQINVVDDNYLLMNSFNLKKVDEPSQINSATNFDFNLAIDGQHVVKQKLLSKFEMCFIFGHFKSSRRN